MSEAPGSTHDFKLTPFVPRYADQVEEWVEGYGYGAPVAVSNSDDEYRAVREGVAVMDFSMLYKFDVEGPGALEVVNRLVARDLRSLAPGRIVYGPIVEENGMMVDDCTTIVFSPEFVRVTGGTERDEELLRELAAGTEVKITERRADIGHLAIQGPRSRELLEAMTDEDVSNEAFPYYTYKPNLDLSGVPTHVNRLGFTAELGYEIWVDADRALELWDALFAAGEPLGLCQIGAVAVMMVRIEAGLIMGEGLEYDSTVSPFECGLGWAIDFEKGDFHGREALVQLKDSAPMRLVTVRLADGGDAASGASLEHAGEQIGHVTMSMPSPYAGATARARPGQAGACGARHERRRAHRRRFNRGGDRPDARLRP